MAWFGLSSEKQKKPVQDQADKVSNADISKTQKPLVDNISPETQRKKDWADKTAWDLKVQVDTEVQKERKIGEFLGNFEWLVPNQDIEAVQKYAQSLPAGVAARIQTKFEIDISDEELQKLMTDTVVNLKKTIAYVCKLWNSGKCRRCDFENAEEQILGLYEGDATRNMKEMKQKVMNIYLDTNFAPGTYALKDMLGKAKIDIK